MKKVLTVAACCAFALALGLVGCGGSSSGSTAASASGSSSAAASENASATSESASAGGDAKDGYTTDGYLDEFGIVTAKALVELDGAELAKVAEAAKYEWDDKNAEWAKVGSGLAPSKGLSSEEMQASNGIEAFEFSEAEVAGFAAGGKGTPVMWLVTSRAKIDDVDTVLANQQVTIVDQCEIGHRNYGRELWAIVKNSAGDQFLMCVQHYDDKSVVDLYTADYIAANEHGIASHFSSGEYLLYDAHTIDEIWPILQSGEVS